MPAFHRRFAITQWNMKVAAAKERRANSDGGMELHTWSGGRAN